MFEMEEQENNKEQIRPVVIDYRSLSEVESLLARIQRVGRATGSVTRALIELTAAHADEEELCFLKISDSSYLNEAVILLSELVARDAERAAQVLDCRGRIDDHAYNVSA